MRQQWTALILSGALICAMSVPALAAAPVESASPPAPEETDSLPDSILYTERWRRSDGMKTARSPACP